MWNSRTPAQERKKYQSLGYLGSKVSAIAYSEMKKVVLLDNLCPSPLNLLLFRPSLWIPDALQSYFGV